MVSSAEALVNTVNTVGVMGKGIALQFKEEFPKNFLTYKVACSSGELIPGRLLITKELVSFPFFFDRLKSATTLIIIHPHHLQILQDDSKATNQKDWYDL